MLFIVNVISKENKNTNRTNPVQDPNTSKNQTVNTKVTKRASFILVLKMASKNQVLIVQKQMWQTK